MSPAEIAVEKWIEASQRNLDEVCVTLRALARGNRSRQELVSLLLAESVWRADAMSTLVRRLLPDVFEKQD